ncbi:Uncharacterised protein [Mycobacteroides abscessus subsp. abscessus]|nr:Uncharacterised protein [Mycobacteroides abscessus subsp. abscessus]
MAQPSFHHAVRIIDPGDPRRKIGGHDNLWPGFAVSTPVGEFGRRGPAGDIAQQRCAAIKRGNGYCRIHGAFIATPRLAVQMKPALRAQHRRRIPHRGFQQHIGGILPHLGTACAHHAADGGDTLIVGDKHITGFESALQIVQRDHRFAGCCEPYPEIATDTRLVVGMHGVPDLEHHVVGRVYRR